MRALADHYFLALWAASWAALERQPQGSHKQPGGLLVPFELDEPRR